MPSELKEDKIPELKAGERTVTQLPHNGFLFLEHNVPALLIYRKRQHDTATLRLARTGASYLIIGDGNFEYYQELLAELSHKMSERFGSFILVEIYKGNQGSSEFLIKGPSHKLPASLSVLADELAQIDSRRYNLKLSARVIKTKDRQAEDQEALFSIEDMKAQGATLIGIEVPPVYCTEKGEKYPIYFKDFRDAFAKALQKAIYEFVRVQSTSDLHNYNALGKHGLHEEMLKIDKQITQIQKSYQFLLLVAPVNINEIRKVFFESNYKELEPYHYRLLPVDPDLLKRQLYNLRIDEIDDPALAYLYDEKRGEIDQELTMLKERDSPNFFYGSVRLYQNITPKLLKEAQKILEELPKDILQREENEELLNAKDFKILAQDEFNFFKKQDVNYSCKVHIRKDVNIMMVSQGELYLPSNYKLTNKEAKGLIQHEIGTHALTFYNGTKQPLNQLAQGFADYDPLQEGIAVLSEYLVGGLQTNRLRTLAGRVIAGSLLLKGNDFKHVFLTLHFDYNFSRERAFNITSRIFQGGGFLKDIIYLKGLVELQEYLCDGGELEPLLAGKFSLKHLPFINDLTKRNILKEPQIKPRYLTGINYQSRIEKFKQGIALSKMI